MPQAWYWIISIMLTLYAVLDGFDFGAGALHLFVAKSNEERRQVLGAIGPYWDGNEVWLLASGGALLVAFPSVMTAAFSGFYLALFVLIWTFIIRAISIEFRSHLTDGLWQSFWDGSFTLASVVIPILLGAALGNVLRGVPLDSSRAFHMPLFTSFTTDNPVGVLDWYTVLIGVFVLLTVLGHGANFLAWKTDGPVAMRAAKAARSLWVIVTTATVLATGATLRVSPQLFQGLLRAPMAWLGTALFASGLGSVFVAITRNQWRTAFLSSSLFVTGLLVATAGSMFPTLLRSSVAQANSLTVGNSASDTMSLGSAIIWWSIGFPLAIGYLALLFFLHRKPPQTKSVE